MRALGALALAVSLFAGSAGAAGAVIDSSRLPPEARERLRAQIAAARRADPASFRAVASVRDRIGELDRAKRGRLVPVTRMLTSIGPGALLPMLELIAFEGRPPEGASRSAWLSLRIGLVEAVGRLRDGRAAPVLSAILETEQERELHTAAAEALGSLGDDASAAKLVALSRAQGSRRLAVLSGMGTCRRVAVARALADALEETSDPATAETIVRSLAEVGNAWAWQTPGLPAPEEQQDVRQLSAAALLGAFVRFEGPVRQAASNGLMVVDAPSTPELISAARKGAAPELLRALSELEERFARNPTR